MGREGLMERDTSQRRAIRQAFREADRPLSPQEALEAAEDAAPGIGMATVYRNLRALQKQGWLCAVEVPGAPTRYELADKGHHHHFQCRLCGRVYEVEGCPGAFNRLAPAGFRLEDHELWLYGLCAACG
jgi:Fur family ferric uptake transcriptional regulator